MVSLPESHRELGKAAIDMMTVDGITIAFKDYNLFKGIWASKWNGLNTFRYIFENREFYLVLRNTLLRIILPLSVPTIAVLSLFYISDPNQYPLQLKLYQLIINNMANDVMQMEGLRMVEALPESLKAASVIFSTLPILLLTLGYNVTLKLELCLARSRSSEKTDNSSMELRLNE